MRGRFPAEGDLGTIHLKDPRISAWSAQSRRDPRSGNESEFHQSPGFCIGEADAFQDGFVAALEIGQRRRPVLRLATELHLIKE